MFFTALKINNTVPALKATAQLFCRPVAVLHNKSLKKKKTNKTSIYILLWIVYKISIVDLYTITIITNITVFFCSLSLGQICCRHSFTFNVKGGHVSVNIIQILLNHIHVLSALSYFHYMGYFQAPYGECWSPFFFHIAVLTSYQCPV